LEDRANQTETETIISIDLLELFVLLCSVIMQQYTLQCTTHSDSSAALPLTPVASTSHLRRGHKEISRANISDAVSHLQFVVLFLQLFDPGVFVLTLSSYVIQTQLHCIHWTRVFSAASVQLLQMTSLNHTTDDSSKQNIIIC